MKKQTIKSDRS